MRFEVEWLEFKVLGSGFGVQGSVFMVQGFGCRVQGLGVRAPDLLLGALLGRLGGRGRLLPSLGGHGLGPCLLRGRLGILLARRFI